MKACTVLLSLFVAANGSFADSRATRQRAAGSAAVPQGGAQPRLRLTPDFASVSQPRLLQYATSNDIPDFTSDFNGNGVALTNATLPRNKYAIGIQTNGMDGGGCVAIDPTNPFGGCVQITNSSGNVVTAQIAREIWTFRLTYLDPMSASSSEQNITYGGDYVLEWVARTPGGHRCFTFYPCDLFGVNLDFLTGTFTMANPNCSMKLGPGYHAYVFYQASPYDQGAVPAGAQEWYPATVAATTTRLEQPGGIIFSKDWSLGRADNALSISGPGIVHPAVDRYTGYRTVAPTIAAGTGTVSVVSYDCGAIPNLAFTIDRELIQNSGGHAHANAPLDQISTLAAYTGTTDASGNWSTTLTAGTIASTIKYTATTNNLFGQPFTATPLLVTTGFASLIDPGPGYQLLYTGQTSTHPNNHNASPELHIMLRDLAERYNLEADPDQQGSLRLNDMSLPVGGLFDKDATWAPPHSRHRFGTDCDISRFVQRADGTLGRTDRDLLLDITENDMDGIGVAESGGRMHVQVPEYQVGTILLREAR